MSTGDKILCATLDEALKRMDELMKDGWDVEFEYRKGCVVELMLTGRIDDA